MHPPSRHRPAASSELGDFLAAAYPRLYSVLKSFKVPPEDADDLVHESILTLLKHGMHGIKNPEGWLLGTLRNKILLYWRWRLRQQRLLALLSRATAASAPAPQERRHAAHDLLALTAHLPPRAFKVLWLRVGLGLRPREVAAILYCRPGSVRKLTRRALELARRDLPGAGHPRPLSRVAPAARSLRHAAPAPSRPQAASAGAAAGSPAADPMPLVPTVQRRGDRRRDLRRGRTSRRAAESVTPRPEARHKP
jgi:RNA polymerase sigma factor (sigma-70 family)